MACAGVISAIRALQRVLRVVRKKKQFWLEALGRKEVEFELDLERWIKFSKVNVGGRTLQSTGQRE